MRELLAPYGWVLQVLFGIVLLKLADLLLGINFKRFVVLLVQELRSLAMRRWDSGSINALGLITVAALGFLMLVGDVVDRVASLVLTHLGEDQAKQLTESVTPGALIHSLLVSALISTYLVNRRR